MNLWELVLTTALSAFFAALAAVAVSMRIAAVDRHRAAQRDVYRALRGHLELLWSFSVTHKAALVQAMQNPITTRPVYYPEKPTLELLVTELFALLKSVPRKSRALLSLEIEKLLTVKRDSHWEEDFHAITRMIDKLFDARW